MLNSREHYFNVTKPFELSIEKFNNDWMLRVKDIFNHNYPLDECDMRKWSKFVKNIVAKEAFKDYKPQIIANVV
ncbi:hypothetical protein G9A89_002359 [Geosiphon pyriformis]|nr:hypothetical protein G9A89_002359 [Geosiphon pyriformis]